MNQMSSDEPKTRFARLSGQFRQNQSFSKLLEVIEVQLKLQKQMAAWSRNPRKKVCQVQCTMTKSGDTMFAHIQGPATQRPADAWITTAALHFISVLVCCAACLEVSIALEESQILHRGPQARRVNTTTMLLVARARTLSCSRVQSICWRRHVSPSPALLSFAPIVCMHAFCRATADTVKNPNKILVPCKPRYIPLECIR